MPNRTSAILDLMRQEHIGPDQIVRHEVNNPDDDPDDWVNQGDTNWRPGQWVDGDLVEAIYRDIYTKLREKGKHREADPGDVFREAYARAQAIEQAVAAAQQDHAADEAADIQTITNKEVLPI